ncbi:MAG: hypothetical protein IJ523_09595 [Succinivibrionaceae bacterium]|nr:hypothetical protein [Succinivibrionaceae bacterium]
MISKEKISSACDGNELSSRLIRQIASDARASREWQTNHLIGSLLRNETPDSFRSGFMDRFNQKLEAEPVHTSGARAEKKDSPIISIFKYLGQAAIAASVAAVSIVGLNYYSVNGNGSVDQVLNTTPYGGSASPVKANIRASSNSLQVVPQTEYRNPAKDIPDYRPNQNGKLSNHELAQIEALLQDHVYQSRMQRVAN